MSNTFQDVHEYNSGLSLFFYGYAKCQWTESRKDAQGKELLVNLTGTEVFSNSRIYLFGSEVGPSLQMAVGSYSFDFEYQLPSMIPSSYEATRGHIRYEIAANMDIPWAVDKEFKVPFKVLRKDDLNVFPLLKRPAQTEYIKTFCSFFCKSGSLILTLILPQSGYVPGQMIRIDINYNNGSSKRIERTRITLRRVTTYKSHTPEIKTVTDSESVAEANAEGVAPGESKRLQAILTIPQNISSTNSYYCSVVQVAYQLKVCAERAGCYVSPIELTMAISIGTIPLNINTNVEISAFQIEDHQNLSLISVKENTRLLE